MNRYRRSVRITINLDALRSNLACARALSDGGKIFATIKADGYGHGAVEVARALTAADGFAVVTLEEALELRESGIEQPVLVLQGPQSRDALDEMRNARFWPVIHDQQQIEWLRDYTEIAQLKCWLKIDTGMGRLGFMPEQAAHLLQASTGITWMGAMTHFASADELDNSFTQAQIERFNTIDSMSGLQKSLANSAAVLAWPASRADWARPGIMLYGCNPLDRALPAGTTLETVMTVTAPLISVKNLPAGAGVGYAQTWQCPEPMPVGYVAIGYRDGLPRSLNDAACVAIGGKHCPVVGRVSMDSIAVDLRSVPDAQVGDGVQVWGTEASVEDLARAAGTISYELLTSIRGQRVYQDSLAG